MSKQGLNPNAHLNHYALNRDKLERAPTRDGYGRGLVEAGTRDANVVVLCADLTESTRSHWFKEKFPDRFVQIGVSEQSLASIAAGMALAGKIPFISSYAVFSPGRNWEQIRTTICIQDVPVKIAGSHAGLTVGEDGATHQMLEDLALMRVLPRMTVVSPCDALEAQKATTAAAKTSDPTYLRFSREASPIFTTKRTPFRLGHIETFRLGSNVMIAATGPLVFDALLAAELLRAKHGVEATVLNIHTLKPFDEKTLIAAARKTGAVVTVEEAQIAGGLGGLVSETLGANCPVPIERVGVQDRFGESGTPAELLHAFGLTTADIIKAAMRAVRRK